MATRKNLTANRESLVHKVRYAASRPNRIAPYLKRAARDRWLAFKHPDHVSYYRAVMASDTRRNPEAAVGSQTHERWLALGRMQFDYLLGHGLKPGSRMLDIGCGNLRVEAGASSTTSTRATTTASTSRRTSSSRRRAP